MVEQRSQGSGSAVANDLDGHLTKFLATLGTAGYVETTLHAKRRLIVAFIRWVSEARIAVADLNGTWVDTFLARRSRRRCKHGDQERTAVQQFLEHLRDVGIVPPCRSSMPSPAEALVWRYIDHLRSVRGLCERSIEVYSPFVRAFVAAQRLPERFETLDASTVRRYLLDHSRNRSVSVVKLLTAALRSFLRFLFCDSRTVTDLSTAVPPVRRWRFAAVPPYLTAEEIERVIAATDRSTARGRRALAILLLLARLGLRAGEVSALELDDIHWDVGEIVVRGKGRLHDRRKRPVMCISTPVTRSRESRGHEKTRIEPAPPTP